MTLTIDLSNIFEPALENLVSKEVGIFGPTSFQDYLNVNGFPKMTAPSAISIDSLERLHSSLRINNAMVFRLGKSAGTGTQFAIAKVNGAVNDFFLIEDNLLSTEGVLYLPKVKDNQLFAYKLLPKLTENSLVNLGFASGLISFALELDVEESIYPPATCCTTFSFEFKPHTLLDYKFTHSNGQVEIDSMFIENRQGKQTLFVIEAKHGFRNRSLAKHKLIYPILSIAPHVPKDVAIVPIYIKTSQSDVGIHYHIVECAFPDPRIEVRAYDELTISKYTHLILPGSMFNQRL